MTGLIRGDAFEQDLEDKVAKEGKYTLRITSAKPKLSKKTDRKMFSFGLMIEGDENYATVFHNVNFPMEDDEPRTQKSMLRDLKRFFHVFNIPTELAIQADSLANDEFESVMGPELAALSGSTGDCLVVQEEAKDASGEKTGEMRNVLRLPKVVA